MKPPLRLLHKNLPYLKRHSRIGPKLVKNYWRKFVVGRHVLRGVEFCLTYHCQLNCGHCLTKRIVDESRSELTVEEIADVTRQLADLGAIFVNFTGGEPLLREDIFEIIERVSRRRDLLVTLASNALAFTPEAAARLSKAGCDMVVFSLDSADPAGHDRSRGEEGAFDRLMDAVDNAKRESLEVWLTTILTEKNEANGDFEDMVVMSRRLGVTLTVNFAYAAGNWAGRRFRYSQGALETFRRALGEQHVRWEGSSNYGPEGCPAGDEKIYITPYGDVFPCAVLQCTFGNVLQSSVEEIYQRITSVPYFDGRCKECLAVMDQDFIDRHLDKMNLDPGNLFSTQLS